MGIDNKYGRVTTEFGNIGEDEPVIVFRAKDIALPDLLLRYHYACAGLNSPRNFLNDILDLRQKIIKWQHNNLNKVKVPD
jgi:hypothetical protein